jgi:hypothetical protein
MENVIFKNASLCLNSLFFLLPGKSRTENGKRHFQNASLCLNSLFFCYLEKVERKMENVIFKMPPYV